MPRVGLEWAKRRNHVSLFSVRGGYAYEPTPIPIQTDETNLLDANKHIVTGGVGVSFSVPALIEAPIAVDAHVQYHALVGRTAAKNVAYDCDDPDERPPVGYPCSGEINYQVDNTEMAIERVLSHYTQAASSANEKPPILDTTDGISLEFSDWRLSLRASNTEPLLRLNIESRGDVHTIDTQLAQIEALIQNSG